MKRSLLVLGLSLSLGIAFAFGADPTTVALVAAGGDRRPTSAVMNRLEAALLQQRELSLVERQQLERILAEHQMTGAALVDRKSRVQLGQWVPADVLVFVDSVPKLPKPASRIQVSEAKSGIVLLSELVENETLTSDPRVALALIQSVLLKGAVPLNDRHILGYLDFRSEESGPLLEDLGKALGFLVITDLARVPQIVVLEREHLQHLQTERDLTKLDQDLRASVRLLEGGIRRTPDTNVLAVTVSLRALAGGASLQVALTVPAHDALVAKNLIVGKIAALLKTKRPEPEPTDRLTEAAIFAVKAKLWTAWGGRERAIHASETAYALDSSQSNRLALAKTLIGDETAPPREVARANEILLDYYRLHTDAVTSGSVTNLALPMLGYHARLPVPTDAAETKNWHQEVARLEDTVFRYQVAHYRKYYDRAAALYWDTWWKRTRRVNVCYPGDPQRQAALVREAVEAFVNPPTPTDTYSWQRLGILADLPHQMGDRTEGNSNEKRTFLPRLPQATFEPVFRDLTQHANPFVRVFAWYAIECILRADAKGPGEKDWLDCRLAIYKIISNDFRPASATAPYHAEGVFSRVSGSSLMDRAAPGWAIDKEIACRREILETTFQRGQVPNRQFLSLSLDEIASHGQIALAAELADKTIALSKGKPYPELVERRKRYDEVLNTKPAPAVPPATPTAPTVRSESGWEDYVISKLNFGYKFTSFIASGSSIVFMLAEGNRLICVHPAAEVEYYGSQIAADPNVDFVVDTYWLPSGEVLEHWGVATGLPIVSRPKMRPHKVQLFAATLGGGDIYVGTELGLGIMTPATKKWTLLTQKDGLPGTLVRALGWYKGRLYLAIGVSPILGEGDDQAVFASYDPATQKFDTIASEKSVGSDNPWNRVKFEVDDIVADEAHECLWVKDRHRGVWKFMPATGAFDPVVPGGPRITMAGSHYNGPQQGGLDAGSSVTLFIPQKQTSQMLPGSVNGSRVIYQACRAVADGDNVIATTGQGTPGSKNALYLLRPGKGAVILSQDSDGQPMPTIIHLYESPAGVVAVDKEGTGLLLRRRSKTQEIQLAELQAESGNESETKLFIAAAGGDSAAVETLLAAGTNPHATNCRGWTPLHYAIHQKRTETALLLLRKLTDVRELAKVRYPLLAVAAEKNDVAVIKELLARHLPVDAVTGAGATPLMVAAAHGSLEAITALLAAGANPNQQFPTGLRNTVLITATENGQLGAVKLLLAHGAKRDGVNQEGNSALIVAASRGQVEILKYLHKQGADLNAFGQYAYTVLMHAVHKNQLKAVGYLVESGANVNLAQSDGTIALMVAAQWSTPEIVQLLVDHGSNVNAVGQAGRTALTWANHRRDLAIMNILRKAGAKDPN